MTDVAKAIEKLEEEMERLEAKARGFVELPATPEGDLMNQDEAIIWIWSSNETPRCGSGQRRVRVRDEGGPKIRLYPLGEPKSPDLINRETFVSIKLEEDHDGDRGTA